jgi:tetratricopeptide (TPR) repeat protein
MLHFQLLTGDGGSAVTETARRLVAIVFALAFAVSVGVGTPVSATESVNSNVLRLINAKQFASARTLFLTQNPSPASVEFLEGRILKVQGRYDEAIAAFRRSLTLAPTSLAARRELAHTLLLNGQYDVAEFHFEALLEVDPNTALHDGYRRFLATIRQNKPFGMSGHFALLPSTNINRGTTNTVFDSSSGAFVIDPNSKAESGVGLQLGLSGYARFSPSPLSRWTVAGSLSGTGYKNEYHNTATAAVSLTYERGFPNGRWSFGPYASYTWREDDADLSVLGLRLGANYRLSSQVSLSTLANHEYRRFPHQAYKDGTYDKLSLSLAYQSDPSLVLRGTLNAEQSRPNASHLQYDGYSLGASLSKVWEGGLTTTLALDGGQRAFVGVYPLTTSPRHDDFASISFSIQNSRFNLKGLAPRLTCSYTANRSNVAFYDYDATECMMTLSTKF